MKKIGIIGAGNWGTALAALLADKGFDVTIWAHEPEVVREITAHHRNPIFLSTLNLPNNIVATTDLKEAAKDKEMVVFVAPSHIARALSKKLNGHIDPGTIFVSCAKGIEVETGELLSDIFAETLPDVPKDNLCFLSGPSFAYEVAQKLPTAVVIAGKNGAAAKKAQETFRTDHFMTFTSEDVVGVQVGGAVKNVIAIACGASDGLGYGHNARAATITRGLYEMIKIGKALGSNPLTFSGLSGIGDLILTCTSELSRNRTVGLKLGKGMSLDEIQKGSKQVAEGISTSKAIQKLVHKLGIIAPICTEVYNMIFEGKSPKAAAIDLVKIELHGELRSII